jgi:hypothetical protein
LNITCNHELEESWHHQSSCLVIFEICHTFPNPGKWTHSLIKILRNLRSLLATFTLLQRIYFTQSVSSAPSWSQLRRCSQNLRGQTVSHFLR